MKEPMTKFEITVVHSFGCTTEIVFAYSECYAKIKAEKQYNNRLSFMQQDRLAKGSYLSNKGI